MLRDAVERLSEASRHIPRNLQTTHPEIPWRKIAGIGNILRHAYPIVDDRLIWEVIARDLPPLKAVVEQILGEMDAGEGGG
jgi:uncharacterized protein with HEPN domain